MHSQTVLNIFVINLHEQLTKPSKCVNPISTVLELRNLCKERRETLPSWIDETIKLMDAYQVPNNTCIASALRMIDLRKVLVILQNAEVINKEEKIELNVTGFMKNEKYATEVKKAAKQMINTHSKPVERTYHSELLFFNN